MLKNKDNYEALIQDGIKNAKIGKLDSAKSSFLNAIELNYKNNQAYINLANIYILQNEFNKSMTLFFSSSLTVGSTTICEISNSVPKIGKSAKGIDS